MTRFALTIEYDGRPYMGWQRQAHGPSVQQAIEEAIHRFTGETVQVFSAGRTDAGVHAIAMRAHVDIAKSLTPFKLTEALNAQLRPAPIAVLADIGIFLVIGQPIPACSFVVLIAGLVTRRAGRPARRLPVAA